MYYKVLNNNMVIDLLTEVRYIRYLSNFNRVLACQKGAAHGIVGSDGETIYKLEDSPSNILEDKKIVNLVEISAEEYSALSTQFAIQKKENEDLRKEVEELKSMVSEQNELLKQLLQKF